MPEPTGENTFRGLALPAYGEWEQLQRNSSATMITLTHSTANTGLFLVGRNSVSSQYWGPGSSAQGGLAFAISAVGGYSVRSGTTVMAEFNSSGLYFAGSQLITSAGAFSGRTGLTTISSAAGSTIYVLTSTQSGRTIVADGGAQGLTIVLPTPAAGLEYTIVQSSAHPAVIDVTSTGGAFDIAFPGGNTTLASTAQAAAPGTTLSGMSARFLAVSASRWMIFPTVNVILGTSVTGEASAGWVAGTTIA